MDSGRERRKQRSRLAHLEAEEQVGAFTRPPASVGDNLGSEVGEQELDIVVRGDCVARSVEPIPYRRYAQIYKTAAKRFGFAEDRYILAAVGKGESTTGRT